MTWPTFKMCDSLKVKELVRRAKILVTNSGRKPQGQWVTNELEWSGDGVYIFHAPGRLLKIFFIPADSGQKMLIYQDDHKKDVTPYATMEYRFTYSALDVVKRHTVLDELAGL